MVGLEDGPVVPGEGAGQGLSRSRDEKKGGLGVDRAVLQTQVRVKKEGEAFQLRTEQTVLIGLTRERNDRDSSITRVINTHMYWTSFPSFLKSCVK